ncbi:hypothetical protein [Hymenobacter daeguensis]
MAKDKKKHSKKDKASENILDAAALSLKKFRKVTKQIGKLSTGQKVVGGIALAAAGLAYLAARETDETAALPAAKDAPADGADDDDDDAKPHKPAGPHHRKRQKFQTG